METKNKIEAILFVKGEPVSLKELARSLDESETEISNALQILGKELLGRGIVLIEAGDDVSLGTSPEMSELVEKIRKESISGELSKAALETLSIILYHPNASRSEIDYIRGVNSSFILRALLIRGLVERKTNPKDARTFIYQPSIQLMSLLGSKNANKLPDFENINSKITQEISGLSEVNTKEENIDG